MEIAKTFTRDSLYSPEDRTQAIQTVKKDRGVGNTTGKAQRGRNTKKQGIEIVTPAYKQFKSWAEEFDSATPEQRKMIACLLLIRVEVGRDCKISVEHNMTCNQFGTKWNVNDFLYTLMHSDDNEPDESISYQGMNLC